MTLLKEKYEDEKKKLSLEMQNRFDSNLNEMNIKNEKMINELKIKYEQEVRNFKID